MRNDLFRKGVVVGIILLFIGTSIIPVLSGNLNTNLETENTDFDIEKSLSFLNDPSWQWTVRGGGTNNDMGQGVVVDASGNAFITGRIQGTVTFGSITLTSQGSYDVFVAKLDTNGAWQWAVRAGGTDDDEGWDVAVDASGNVFITGWLKGTVWFGGIMLVSQGNYDVFVAKLNTNGTWQWAVRAGGTELDEGWGVAVDASGNAYITGGFHGTATFGSTTLISEGSRDVFVAKLNTNGAWQWAVRAGGTDIDDGTGVAVDTDGNVYITGLFYGTATFGGTTLISYGVGDVFVSKFGSGGVNQPPVFGTPTPVNGSTNNPLSLSWSIQINEPEGDLFSWTIQCSNGQVNSGTGATNGTKSLTLSSLAYSTAYKVWVNATDPTGSGLYTRKWYTFTTQQQQNVPPNKPNKPSGTASGKINTVYTYTTRTTDPNGDQVYYMWDWGDGTQSNWLGPYNSGVTISTTHTWTVKGSYSIKVIAKDTSAAESPWSDPLPIKMPYSPNNPMLQFLELLFHRFPHAFPILRQLLGY